MPGTAERLEFRFTNRDKRRAARASESLRSCACCSFPLTERHHLLPVAEFGENDFTVQLCPNCHRLYHLIYSCYIKERKGAQRRFQQFLLRGGFGNKQAKRLLELAWYGEACEKAASAASLTTGEAINEGRTHLGSDSAGRIWSERFREHLGSSGVDRPSWLDAANPC